MPSLAQRYDLEKNAAATAHRNYKKTSSGEMLPYSLTMVRPVGVKATNMEFFHASCGRQTSHLERTMESLSIDH